MKLKLIVSLAVAAMLAACGGGDPPAPDKESIPSQRCFVQSTGTWGDCS